MLYIFIFLILTACSKHPPVNDEVVSSIIADRIEAQVNWRRCACQDEEISEQIQTLISQELTADSAIQIALLNNPTIQATFENLGLAESDLVRAGLFSNPNFSLEVRYPTSSGLHTNIEYLITATLLDIFLIPLRTRLAETEFEQTKLKVANEILQLAFDVRETYYAIVTLNEEIQIMESVTKLAAIMSEISNRQRAVENINFLELQLMQAQNLRSELLLLQAKTDLVHFKEKFYRLLGLTEEPCILFSPLDLPFFAIENFELCALEEVALSERLDLQVARFEMARLCQMLGLKEWWVYTNLQAGLAGEREADGTNVIGPGFEGEIPLFNYGQADRMRIFAELRQKQEQIAALEIQIRSEVREAYYLLTNYKEILTEYQCQLLPLQEMILNSSEALYNVMGLGLDKLLVNKRIELENHQNYLKSVKSYLTARVELDRALGGNLSRLCLGVIE